MSFRRRSFQIGWAQVLFGHCGPPTAPQGGWVQNNYKCFLDNGLEWKMFSSYINPLKFLNKCFSTRGYMQLVYEWVNGWTFGPLWRCWNALYKCSPIYHLLCYVLSRSVCMYTRWPFHEQVKTLWFGVTVWQDGWLERKERFESM